MIIIDILKKSINTLEKIIENKKLKESSLTIRARGLEPEEAIGSPKRKDYPLLQGKEVMIEAEFKGAFGQAFTDHPVDFNGSLNEVLKLDLENTANRALNVAALNAVLKYLNIAEKTVHCRDEKPESCADEIAEYIKEDFNNPYKILLIGLQPAILDSLVSNFRNSQIKVTDLNSDMIGKEKSGIKIFDGKRMNKKFIKDADFILCTGSVIVNGSINELLSKFEKYNKKYFFFGNTISGTAVLNQLPHLCFYGS
jgi:uncharacterized protein (DUF4213/DUF364 family)